jgi:TonB family protein
MRPVRLAPVLGLLLAGAAGAGAQAGVEGTVTTTEGGRPLAYAHVEVVGGDASDWTDERGLYRLGGLEPGEWQLRVAHPGHDSLQVGLVVPSDRSIRLDITLRARPGPAVDALADFEPFEIKHTLPALLNSDEVSRLMQRLYPPDLARQRVGGEAVLMIWLDEGGQVVRSELTASSGQRALDAVALTVTDSMRFRPARNQDRAVRVYVRIPVIFTVPDSVARALSRPTGRRR